MLGDVRAVGGGQALRLIRVVAVILVILALGGCGSFGAAESSGSGGAAAGFYTVRTGNTLYSIAARYGLDYRDLALWNRLGDGSLIYPGQRLRLRPPQGSAQGGTVPGGADVLEPPPAQWRWPTDGAVVLGFAASPKTASGILVGGRAGQPVVAAAAGEVVYAGSGLAGYGQLLIIRHNAAWLSAYGHNEQLLVGEGVRVTAGQQIARMGEGPGQQPALHFEIRRNGQPVDPLAYLRPAQSVTR